MNLNKSWGSNIRTSFNFTLEHTNTRQSDIKNRVSTALGTQHSQTAAIKYSASKCNHKHSGSGSGGGVGVCVGVWW